MGVPLIDNLFGPRPFGLRQPDADILHVDRHAEMSIEMAVGYVWPNLTNVVSVVVVSVVVLPVLSRRRRPETT